MPAILRSGTAPPSTETLSRLSYAAHMVGVVTACICVMAAFTVQVLIVVPLSIPFWIIGQSPGHERRACRAHASSWPPGYTCRSYPATAMARALVSASASPYRPFYPSRAEPVRGEGRDDWHARAQAARRACTPRHGPSACTLASSTCTIACSPRECLYTATVRQSATPPSRHAPCLTSSAHRRPRPPQSTLCRPCA